MTASIERIESLLETLAAFWEREREVCEGLLANLSSSVRVLKGDTGDRRLHSLLVRTEELSRRLKLLMEMSRDDFLAKLRQETRSLRSTGSAGGVEELLSQLLPEPPVPVEEYCARLLDATVAVTGAERGFVALYTPESTAVEIAAARDFESRNLSLQEYRMSRSLLRTVLTRGEALVVDDATGHPSYSLEESVRELNLRSVLVVPLKDRERTLGAIYLEHRSRPGVFGSAEISLLSFAARVAVFYLHHSGILARPPRGETAVFLDGERVDDEIVGQAPGVLALRGEIRKIAPSDATVLIEGETGTGKELVAAALHAHSSRREGPFVAVNCAAIPDSLVESELFGHEKGAFTGATQTRAGQVEVACGGTLFLDEINELPYAIQAKLLRFLQLSEYRRVGGPTTLRADVRVVAATSKDLRRLIEEHKFQEALFYRLYVIPLRVPTLRERRDDIPVLAQHFGQRFARHYGRTAQFAPGVLERLQAHDFPGNVRELENLIHRLVVRADDGWIRVADLPADVFAAGPGRVSLGPASIADLVESQPSDLAELKARREKLRRHFAGQERALVERVVSECQGNLTEAAKRLGLHRGTLHKIRGRTPDRRGD